MTYKYIKYINTCGKEILEAGGWGIKLLQEII